MKVAHINHSYGLLGSCGTEQSVPNTCALLEAEGIRTCVLYDQATGPAAAVAGRATYHLPGLCGYSLLPRYPLIQQALAVLEYERVDVVHLHQINNGALVRAIAARWPTLWFVHNHILTCPSGTRFFRRSATMCPQRGPAPSCISNAYWQQCGSRRPARVLRALFDCLDARANARGLWLGVDSGYMQATLVAAGFPARNVVVTPTVTEVVPPPADDYPRHSPPRILYVGQLSEVKGLPLLLDILAQLAVPWVLDIAGEGYLLPALRQQVERLGLAPRVTLHGHVGRAKLGELLRGCAVLAVPTRYPEPFGLVGPEAMARARPVVAFAVGGIPEWLQDGETGWLVAPEDAAGFRRRLSHLLTHPAEARAMGRAGRRVWEERFHPRQHVATLLQAYAAACRHPHPARLTLEARPCE